MSEKPTLSILIPAYNAESTIELCLESVLSQKTGSYEVIIVDDGSTDHTYDVLQKYINFDQVLIIRQENHGVSYTRQVLIEKARGKYILFCDADDCLEPSAIYNVSKTIEMHMNEGTQTIDLYVFGYNILQTNGKKSVLRRDLESGVYTKEQYAKHHIDGLNDLYYSVLWNKCFRRDIIFSSPGLQFEKLIEDVIFNIDYIGRCETICIVEQIIYNYSQIGESLTRSHKSDSKKDISDALTAYRVLEEKAYKTYPNHFADINKYICYKLLGLMNRARVLNDDEMEAQIQGTLEIYKERLGISYISVKVKELQSSAKTAIKKMLNKKR